MTTSRGDADKVMFSERLRHLMREQGYSQQKLADEIGVKRQSVSQYCDASAWPAINNLSAMADLFGVSTDYLLGRIDCRSPEIESIAVNRLYGLSDKSMDMLRKTARAVTINTSEEPLTMDFTGANRFVNLIMERMNPVEVAALFTHFCDTDAHAHSGIGHALRSASLNEHYGTPDENGFVKLYADEAKHYFVQRLVEHVRSLLNGEGCENAQKEERQP